MYDTTHQKLEIFGFVTGTVTSLYHQTTWLISHCMNTTGPNFFFMDDNVPAHMGHHEWSCLHFFHACPGRESTWQRHEMLSDWN